MSRPARKARKAATAAAARAVPIAVAARPSVGSVPNVDRINAVNVGLIFLSAAAAWVLPFEVFMLAYAVLGPLHYLTEISWLHDRRYFTTSRWDLLPLVLLGVVIFAARYLGTFTWNGWVVVAFGLAGAMAFVSSPWVKVACGAAAVAATLLLERWGTGFFVLVVMLPTLIHVCLFTLVFMLQGSRKTNSTWGYASVVAYVLCGAGLLLYQPATGPLVLGEQSSVLVKEFVPVIDMVAAWTGTTFEGSANGFVAIGRFLGFAYAYHYLNWFSKTGVIGWHTVSRRRLAVIGALYVASLAVYAYDYATGLVALFFLSLLHVLLEFPLDLRTIAGLTKASSARRAPALASS